MGHMDWAVTAKGLTMLEYSFHAGGESDKHEVIRQRPRSTLLARCSSSVLVGPSGCHRPSCRHRFH